MTITLPANWTEMVGRVAADEFNNAADTYKPALLDWAQNLHTLTDDGFVDVATEAIYNAANAGRFNGNWDHEHFKASACFNESRRRHAAAGHAGYCQDDTLYSRAYAKALRAAGHRAPETTPCRCGKG